MEHRTSILFHILIDLHATLSVQQYRCTSGLNWTQLGKSVTVATVCGHSPCQQVQCDVKTYNDAGDSQIASSSVVTTSETGK